jgi:hypothetical protein
MSCPNYYPSWIRLVLGEFAGSQDILFLFSILREFARICLTLETNQMNNICDLFEVFNRRGVNEVEND